MGLRKILNSFEIVPINKLASIFVIISVSTSLIEKIKMFTKFIKSKNLLELFICFLIFIEIFVAQYIIYISDQHFSTLKKDIK